MSCIVARRGVVVVVVVGCCCCCCCCWHSWYVCENKAMINPRMLSHVDIIYFPNMTKLPSKRFEYLQLEYLKVAEWLASG